MLQILTLVDQHGPLTRLQLAGAMDMSVEKIEKRVRKLEDLGGLKVVDPLPEDRWTTTQRLAIGSAVVGWVAGALGAMDDLPAPPEAAGRRRPVKLTEIDAATLEGCRRVADADGWIRMPDLIADLGDRGVRRELVYYRTQSLVDKGFVIREEVTEATRETKGQRYRWRLAEAGSGEQQAA